MRSVARPASAAITMRARTRHATNVDSNEHHYADDRVLHHNVGVDATRREQAKVRDALGEERNRGLTGRRDAREQSVTMRPARSSGLTSKPRLKVSLMLGGFGSVASVIRCTPLPLRPGA